MPAGERSGSGSAGRSSIDSGSGNAGGSSIDSGSSGLTGMPRHVAIIMDGNGRWAEQAGKRKLTGHDAGMKAMKRIVRRSSELGIECLTVYAFSTENWKRSRDEVSGIFRLLVKYVGSELEELHGNNVVVQAIGEVSKLPPEARKALSRSIDRTQGNTGLRFTIALNYGSRAEIARAARLLAEDAASGSITPADVTEDALAARLYTAGMPDPDLVIRTSGEQRLSNFLLWQCAYSEFVFTDVLWPDFSPEEYERCLEEYRTRERRFGGRSQ
ncbi:MAG: isoprenyl transferase [Clostridiales Family XIII bacterium]|jgi:undecaprenyl diphosphate synthase|nr:isoprenyl transferase [Clostridiales Family XIII bacterium]